MADSNNGGSRNHLNRRSQESAAVLNKLIRPQHISGGNTGARANVPDQQELMPLVREQMQRRMDSDNTFDILPDAQFAADIVISSILSSKDLITTTLLYECTSTTLPIELKSDMLKVIQDYFTKTKPMKNFLYDMLFAAMYKSGSYAVGIIPESSVDKIINDGGKVSLEEHAQTSMLNSLTLALAPTGVLGPIDASTDKVGLEAIFGAAPVPTKDMLTFKIGDDLGSVTLTDNLDVLKIPTMHQMALHRKSRAKQAVAMEAAGLTFDIYDQDVYKNRNYRHKNVEEVLPVESGSRLTVGHPLEQVFPSESLVPVCVPGNVRHHLGYLCVLDDLGYPISKNSLMNNAAAVSWIFSDVKSAAIDDAAKGLGFGARQDTEKWTAAKLVESYTELVEAKLIASLKNGGFGDSVNLVKPQEVYRIMMARALAKKHTQILYIPAEQMCYFALDYDEYGMGRSLIDKTKLVGTIRTAMMMGSMQCSVLNATRETEYTITLDQNDRDPEKTIRNIEQGIMEAFANDIPYSGTPDDMAAYFSRAGIRFNIEGNDYYPSTKVSKNDNNPDYKPPEKESEEFYQRMHLRGLLADPDTIMNPENIEFAAQVTSKSILNAKRIIMVQERMAPQITHYVKTYTISDGVLLRKLADIAKAYYADAVKAVENDVGDVEAVTAVDGAGTEDFGNSPDRMDAKLRGKINHAVSHFIETISIGLPPPESSMLNSQKQAFDDRVEALDKFLEHIVSDDTLAGTKYEGDTDRARGIIKSYLLRMWLRDNDVDRDLQNLFDVDSVEEVLANIVENNLTHADWVIRLLKKQDDRKATLADNRDVAGGGDDAGGDYGSTSGTEGDDLGGGGDEFSEDGDLGDFGGGDENSTEGVDDAANGDTTGDDAVQEVKDLQPVDEDEVVDIDTHGTLADVESSDQKPNENQEVEKEPADGATKADEPKKDETDESDNPEAKNKEEPNKA